MTQLRVMSKDEGFYQLSHIYHRLFAVSIFSCERNSCIRHGLRGKCFRIAIAESNANFTLGNLMQQRKALKVKWHGQEIPADERNP